MKNDNKRIAIYRKDVHEITGKSLRWSQRKLNDIRKKKAKNRTLRWRVL